LVISRYEIENEFTDLAQLKELSDLHNSGALNADEFQAAKRRLL